MKKIFLMGRSEAGKTSLTQALKGEELHYHKTQYTNSNEDTIDSPGEYAESKHFSVGLACFSFEADVIAIVQAADEPFNLFSDGSRCFLLRPLIGIITKVDSQYANLPMVRQWMQNMGCERIFEVNNVTREGIPELMEYLKEDLPKLTLEQAKFKQSLGLNEWQPLPEGVEYPEYQITKIKIINFTKYRVVQRHTVMCVFFYVKLLRNVLIFKNASAFLLRDADGRKMKRMKSFQK